MPGLLAELHDKGFKVVHMVAKAPVATIASYDAAAEKAIAAKTASKSADPMAQRSLVWTMTPARAEAALAMDDRAFIDALSVHAGARIGRIVSAGPRRTFPLVLEYAKPAALPPERTGRSIAPSSVSGNGNCSLARRVTACPLHYIGRLARPLSLAVR